ncbi:hypothetical protein TNCV_2872081 [Trichonephila clavipes]|nr:hypothetical protein TNCV_2872081 [Trichonephila clavipes]
MTLESKRGAPENFGGKMLFGKEALQTVREKALYVEMLSEYLFPAGKLHLLSLELWVCVLHQNCCVVRVKADSREACSRDIIDVDVK